MPLALLKLEKMKGKECCFKSKTDKITKSKQSQFNVNESTCEYEYKKENKRKKNANQLGL